MPTCLTFALLGWLYRLRNTLIASRFASSSGDEVVDGRLRFVVGSAGFLWFLGRGGGLYGSDVVEGSRKRNDLS